MSLLISAVLPEPLLLAFTKYGSRGRLRPKPGLLAPLVGCECFKSDFMHILPSNYQISKEVVHELEFGDIAVMQI